LQGFLGIRQDSKSLQNHRIKGKLFITEIEVSFIGFLNILISESKKFLEVNKKLELADNISECYYINA
jgi:hypothetical protein